MSKKKKYYVVWVGQNPGIYDSWAACQQQVKGFNNARYKSFTSLEEAQEAFSGSATQHIFTNKSKSKTKTTSSVGIKSRSNIIWDSISVDAACSGNPGKMEYQGVHTQDKDQIFHQQFALGTNNIGEFLAIVHALAYMKDKEDNRPIYSDSKIAMGWVKKKHCKTSLVKNNKTKKLHDLIKRAEIWLANNTYSNQILKWETEAWGEIPADFGRK